jgi:hypothetical protein
MTVKNPYEPPTYGVVNVAIERRIAGKPPASVDDGEESDVSVKAEPAHSNKAARKPANKAAE